MWLWLVVAKGLEQECGISTWALLSLWITSSQPIYALLPKWILVSYWRGQCQIISWTLESTFYVFPSNQPLPSVKTGLKTKLECDRGKNIRRVLWNLKHLNQQWTNLVLCDLCSKLVHILGYLNGRLKSPIFLWPVDVSGTYVLLAWPLCILYK